MAELHGQAPRWTQAERRRDWRPIADYAAIGDCHGGALVASDGGVDWCTLGRFDADPIFCRLLDRSRGGYFATPVAGELSSRRAYLEGSNVLATETECDSGALRRFDFMPVGRAPGATVHDYVNLEAPGWLVRTLECKRGSVRLEIHIAACRGYGRAPARLRAAPFGATIVGSDMQIACDRPLSIDGGGAHAEITLAAGERCFVAIGANAARASPPAIARLCEVTLAFWREWIGLARYEGPHRAAVLRSALALKMLTFAPTGAAVAAMTTSLPEEVGGERNWDYRYCWMRDASLMLHALALLGYSAESRRFFDFIHGICARGPGQLQVMYGIDRARHLEEHIVDHLSGWRESRPVRVGNAAYTQRQSDLHGYALEGARLYAALGGAIEERDCRRYVEIVDFIAECWHEPDLGLWEIRGAPRHFVFSKAMCWVVVDRALRLFGPRPDWIALREEIWRAIDERGRAPGHAHLVDALDETDPDALDAALLQLPLLGLPLDAATRSATIAAVERVLREGDFVRRYRTEGGRRCTLDGIRGGEGAFFVTSFWLVDALLADGRGADAERLFERLLARANDLGLYSEQIDPASGELLGNVPQAFTHMGLIVSASHLALFHKHGVAGLAGGPAERAERTVGATLGWRGVLAGIRQTGRINVVSSRESVLDLNRLWRGR